METTYKTVLAKILQDHPEYSDFYNKLISKKVENRTVDDLIEKFEESCKSYWEKFESEEFYIAVHHFIAVNSLWKKIGPILRDYMFGKYNDIDVLYMYLCEMYTAILLHEKNAIEKSYLNSLVAHKFCSNVYLDRKIDINTLVEIFTDKLINFITGQLKKDGLAVCKVRCRYPLKTTTRTYHPDDNGELTVLNEEFLKEQASKEIRSE